MSPRKKKSTKTSFELSPDQENILNASGNLLVLGGPGSGKNYRRDFKSGQTRQGTLRIHAEDPFSQFRPGNSIQSAGGRRTTFLDHRRNEDAT